MPRVHEHDVSINYLLCQQQVTVTLSLYLSLSLYWLYPDIIQAGTLTYSSHFSISIN